MASPPIELVPSTHYDPIETPPYARNWTHINLPAYLYNYVYKVTTNDKRQGRHLVITQDFIMILDETAPTPLVKRVFQLKDLRHVVLQEAKEPQILFACESTLSEPTLWVGFPRHPHNATDALEILNLVSYLRRPFTNSWLPMYRVAPGQNLRKLGPEIAGTFEKSRSYSPPTEKMRRFSAQQRPSTPYDETYTSPVDLFARDIVVPPPPPDSEGNFPSKQKPRPASAEFAAEPPPPEAASSSDEHSRQGRLSQYQFPAADGAPPPRVAEPMDEAIRYDVHAAPGEPLGLRYIAGNEQLLVSHIDEGGAAERAGMPPGVIYLYDGVRCSTGAEFEAQNRARVAEGRTVATFHLIPFGEPVNDAYRQRRATEGPDVKHVSDSASSATSYGHDDLSPPPLIPAQGGGGTPWARAAPLPHNPDSLASTVNQKVNVPVLDDAALNALRGTPDRRPLHAESPPAPAAGGGRGLVPLARVPPRYDPGFRSFFEGKSVYFIGDAMTFAGGDRRPPELAVVALTAHGLYVCRPQGEVARCLPFDGVAGVTPLPEHKLRVKAGDKGGDLLLLCRDREDLLEKLHALSSPPPAGIAATGGQAQQVLVGPAGTRVPKARVPSYTSSSKPPSSYAVATRRVEHVEPSRSGDASYENVPSVSARTSSPPSSVARSSGNGSSSSRWVSRGRSPAGAGAGAGDGGELAAALAKRRALHDKHEEDQEKQRALHDKHEEDQEKQRAARRQEKRLRELKGEREASRKREEASDTSSLASSEQPKLYLQSSATRDEETERRKARVSMWRDEERAAEERLAALHERYATREGEAKRRLDRELARYEDRHAQLLQVLRRAGDSGSGGDNIKNTTATTTTTTTSSSSSSSNNNDSSGSSSADGAAAIKSGKSEGGELGRRESEGGPAPAAGKKSGADRRRHEAERVAVERELGRMRAEVADAERRKAALDAEAREAELRIQRRQRELRRLQECQGEQQAAEQEHRRTLEELQSKIKRRETQVDEQMARRIRLPDSESRTSCTLPMDRNYSGAKPQRDSVHRKGQEADHTASDDSLQAALVPPRRASCVDDWPRTHSKSGDKRRPSDKQRDRELQTAFKEAVIAERERDNARRNSGVVPSDRQDMPPMADHFEFETLVSQSLDSVLMLYPRFSDNYFSCAPQRQQEIMRAWVMRDRDAWLKERLLRCFYSGSFSEVSTSSPRLLPKDVHASAFSTPALSPISGSPELSSSRDPPPPADDAAGVVLGLGSSADPSRDDRPAQFRRWSRGSIDTGARHTSGVR